MTRVNQPTYAPTNKLTTAVLVTMATAAGLEIMQGWAAEHAPYLTGPAVETLLITAAPALVGGIVAWFIRDEANT